MKCGNPDCNGAEMELVHTRADGCRYFVCPICQQGVGEETEEWFEQQRKYEESVSQRVIQDCDIEKQKVSRK
jgi:hypothetical protein